MRRFTMTVEPFGADSVRVALSGELDVHRAFTFDEEMRRIEAVRPPLILLDLRDLAFVDSSGLAGVLACHRRARRDGRRLVVARSPGPVHRVMELSALDELLEVVDEPEHALAA